MKVTFVPQNIVVEVENSTKSVLEIAKENNVHIKSVCGGTPSCAECRVQVSEGEHNLLPPSEKELSLIGTAHFVDHSRLSCQMRCFGDVTIDLNEQLQKQAQGSTTKKPRGKAQKAEGEESYAVEGSILLGGADLEIFGSSAANTIDRTNERRAVEVFDQDETRRALEQIRRQRAAAEAKQAGDEDDYLNKLKKRNKKFAEYGSSDDSEQDLDLSKVEDRPNSENRDARSNNDRNKNHQKRHNNNNNSNNNKHRNHANKNRPNPNKNEGQKAGNAKPTGESRNGQNSRPNSNQGAQNNNNRPKNSSNQNRNRNKPN